MHIHIEIDTPLSEGDKALLRSLTGDAAPSAVTIVANEVAPEKPAKAAAKPKAEPVAPVEEAPAGDVPTMADAVDLATKFVSSGKSAQVKAALAELGAARVSELKDADIPKFMGALDLV